MTNGGSHYYLSSRTIQVPNDSTSFLIAQKAIEEFRLDQEYM